MSSFLTTAVGIAFTVIVCLYAARTLLGPWLRVRRDSADNADSTGERHSRGARSAAPFHTA